MDRFPINAKRLYRSGEREAALEQNLVEQVFAAAALLDVVDMQLKLLPKRIGCGCLRGGVPDVKIGGCQLEYAEALLWLIAKIELSFTFFLVPLDDAANTLLGNVGYCLESVLPCRCVNPRSIVVLNASWLGKLYKNESSTLD